MSLRDRILEFLYGQVSENKIPMIRKGMVEDFERFVENELANAETSRVAKRMVSSDEGEDEENN